MPEASNHVLLVAPDPADLFPPVQYQARLLADAGYRVTLLTSFRRDWDHVAFNHPGVAVIAYPIAAAGRARRNATRVLYALRLARLRRSLKPIAEISYNPIGLFFSRFCPGRPALFIAHLHEAFTDPEKEFYERQAVPFLKRLSHVVVADRSRAELLAQQLEGPLPMVVRNVPLVSDFDAPDPVAGAPFSVVYHGSIGVAQALDTVIRSMSSWPPEVKFHIYGSPGGDIKESLAAVAREAGVEERIVYEGWIDNTKMIGALSRHSVGLSMYRHLHINLVLTAGASNKRYQLMLAGLPQISDDAPDVKTLLEGERVGYCVSTESPEEIAAAVNRLYADRALCAEYGERARAVILERFRYDLEFQPIIDLFDRASGRKMHVG